MNNSNNIEIERKFLLKELPHNLSAYSHHIIEQGYLCQRPVVRIRRQDDDYYMTYKGKGMLERSEYNLPLTKEAYEHLLPKVDGHLIKKTRYNIPLEKDPALFKDASVAAFKTLAQCEDFKIELDIFDYPENLILAEIEFPCRELADTFIMPDYFSCDVTDDPKYHNVNMI